MDQTFISALQRISGSLAAGANLDTVLESFRSVLAEMLGASRWSVMLKTSSDHMRIRASQGIPEDVVDQVVVNLGEGIAGRVAETGEGGLISDVLGRESQTSGGNYAAQSAICVPILFRDEVLGVINLNDKLSPDGSVAEFDEQDLILSLILANQAAMALYSARELSRAQEFQKLQARAGKLEAEVGALGIQAEAFDLVCSVSDAAGLMYGQERLKEALREVHADTPDDIVREIRKRVSAFSHPKPLRDDVSLVITKLV